MNSPPPFCGAEASNTLNTRQDTTISDITNSQKRASDSIHNNTLKVITKKPKRTGETDTKEYEEQIDVESVDSDVVSITEIDNNSNNDTLIQDKLPAARYTRSQQQQQKSKQRKVGTPTSVMRRRLLPTGYVYDVFMSFHATPDPTEIHPEDPRRIFKIYNILAKNGILAECKRIKSRKATRSEILLAHTPSHYQSILDTAYLTKRSDYMALERKYNSIYLNANSFESALYAAGCLIELVQAVHNDVIRNAFAIIRPPGHHAETDMPMGFCLFNNVAVAALDCLEKGCRRILILDWDVHFGNGTQAIFAEDERVLYMSLHRYDDGNFYPHDTKADMDNVGRNAGTGTTVNVPWPCTGMTDADYMYAFRQVVMPIACEFDPELVIVSAGFDAAINDPIGKCKVTPAGYGQMTHQLKTLANGKLVVALEGGYDLNSIATSALACMQVLLGEAPKHIDPFLLPQRACIETVEKVKQIQSQYWKSCI